MPREPKQSNNTLIHAHVLDGLDLLKPNSIQVVVTSPPYWGMRLYRRGMRAIWSDGLPVPFGVEARPEQYVQRTKEVLTRLLKPLKDNGIVWWNIADTYFTRAIVRASSSERLDAFEGRRRDNWRDARYKRYSSGHEYLKDKDLTLIPFLIALEAQKIGYWVRSIVVWKKENFVPEPRVDRPVVAHEYILMLTKSRKYKWNSRLAIENVIGGEQTANRQLRSVWTFGTSKGNGHPAPFPEALVERCIKVSTDKSDIVLDPFMGSGTTALVASRLYRRFIGIDNVKSYLQQTAERVEKETGESPIWCQVQRKTPK